MTLPLLNLDDAPTDPIERLMYLSGVKEQAAEELEAALSDAYYIARLQGRLKAALAAGPYARKRVLALTRHENEKRGRSIRWGDGADSTSTSYNPVTWDTRRRGKGTAALPPS